ncbi:RimK family protein [Marinobacterium sediminicola]|uniref:Glutathione synthase/RimK-type ligase, ATP-grasp superfamily n=1 Tax=Marinobacterium sediminicola TaxID=518898 RepID=A0ABY1RYU2_9GAMM|nr:RimK family protein [Marinobacterium sediminicola]ULG68055.1 RimK family protein [Marinobacterium sediminicola]SMR73435.1 Glutathione synthase/RimK-type ligase, ATP-grasp superfamily [Marinobacterium sediminicola]
MTKLMIIVDRKEDWQAFYPAEQLLSAHEYLAQGSRKSRTPVQIINLCRHYRYLSYGYYTSLLAEARGHKVIPSIQTINDLGRKSIYGLSMKDLNLTLGKLVSKHSSLREQLEADQRLKVTICFGQTLFAPLQDLARQLFEQFPCPILHLTFRKGDAWEIETVKAGGLNQLQEAEEDLFASAIDAFSRKLWRKPVARKKYRYDLAILVDREEQQPPSDALAIKRFIRAGRQLGIDVSLIGKKDFGHLAEYDGLFIRETTSISNHTYRFAKKAEREGLVVFDDPTSIMRCCNKVFLSDLLATNGVEMPETHLLYKDDRKELKALAQSLSYPRVMKIPDGAFSKGVVKVNSAEELISQAETYFKQSAIVLVQEFMYTEYDWRIGILNNKPLYACKYMMTRGHWQIYNYSSGDTESGDFETLPIHEVPAKVVKTALKATKMIGDGLYGVDLKQSGDRVVVIEVNDNPSIDSGVEDLYLKDSLYRMIMEEFLRRMERRRLGIGH